MKFVGNIGFYVGDEEIKPRVFVNSIIEKHYIGDILQESRSFQTVNEEQNDSFTISNRISIYTDLYFINHWPSIRYVDWNGTKWKVRKVTINYPKATLEIGGAYNGAERAGS